MQLFESFCCSVQIDSGNEEMNVVVAELIASDLLADPYGGIALKTMHRFMAYNMEWIGQVKYLIKNLNLTKL